MVRFRCVTGLLASGWLDLTCVVGILCLGRPASIGITLLAQHYKWQCIAYGLRRRDLLYVEYRVHDRASGDIGSELRRVCKYCVTSRSGCDHNSVCQRVEAGRLGVGKCGLSTRPFALGCDIKSCTQRRDYIWNMWLNLLLSSVLYLIW